MDIPGWNPGRSSVGDHLFGGVLPAVFSATAWKPTHDQDWAHRSASEITHAALTRPMWLKACGKLSSSFQSGAMQCQMGGLTGTEDHLAVGRAVIQLEI